MKKKIEKEAALLLARLYKQLKSKGPYNVKAFLLEDMLIFRFNGILTEAEQILARTESGRRFVKEMSWRLHEAIKPILVQEMEAKLELKIQEFYIDFNCQQNEGVAVCIIAGQHPEPDK